MRTIKFRAWDKKNQRWLDINEIVNDWGNTPWIDAMCVSGNTIFELRDSVEDLEWLQFTGLLDKNGKEVFEGDLVKVLDRDWPSQMDSHPELNHQQYLDSISSICEVVWDKGSFWLEQRKGKGYYYPQVAADRRRDVFEVIGNIYENPELLSPQTVSVEETL